MVVYCNKYDESILFASVSAFKLARYNFIPSFMTLLKLSINFRIL